MTFDFSSLSKKQQEVQQIDSNEIMNKLIAEIDRRISKVKSGLSKKEVESIVNARIASEASMFVPDVVELWKEVFPSLRKMWGTSSGIGKKIGMINMLLVKDA